MVNPDDLHRAKEFALARNLYRRLVLLGVSTVILMFLLALVPAKAYFSEWRAIQTEYNKQAVAAGLPAMEVRVQQIWREEIELTDRCTTCHVGKGAATPLPDGGPLFGPHPPIHHTPGRMGCTICHGGQGRATTKEDAHGFVKHWDEPMLPVSVAQASCGQCHGRSVAVPATRDAEHGEYLFELHGCKTCHRVEHEGGDIGPELSAVALKGFSREWHVKHLREPAAIVEGSRMMSFGHLRDDEIDALLVYLDTLIGAPTYVRGKALAREAGCRGCHVIGGIGGQHGPPLADSAATLAIDRDFSNVEGPKTTVNWHVAHLRDPAGVSPDSKMPAVALPPDDELALVAFILAERDAGLPLEQMPKAAILSGLHEDHRDYDSESGAEIFQLFCSACHGNDGLGQVMPSLDRTVPAIANPDFLAVASDDFLRRTIREGRLDRDMPPWGGKNGLTDKEIDAVIAWLRERQPIRPAYEQVLAAAADPDRGGRLFASECSGCHGPEGAGTPIATSLINDELAVVASDEFLYETITRGRPNTAMPAHPQLDARAVASLIAWLRRGRSTEQGRKDLAERLFVASLHEYKANGSQAYGEVLYKSLCVGCHGVDALGGVGPAISNPHFLRTATDGFIAGSILLGRGQRGMRPFDATGLAAMKRRDVDDIIVYLRALGGQDREVVGVRRVQGIPTRGQELFASACAGCHGVEGTGGVGPALANVEFLDAATDGFLQATIARGRDGTGMRAWARGGLRLRRTLPARDQRHHRVHPHVADRRCEVRLKRRSLLKMGGEGRSGRRPRRLWR